MAYIYDLEEQAREDFERLYENGSGTTYDPAGYEVRTTNEYYAKALNVPGATFGRWLDQYREERDANKKRARRRRLYRSEKPEALTRRRRSKLKKGRK